MSRRIIENRICSNCTELVRHRWKDRLLHAKTTPPPFWFIHSDVCKCSCRTAPGILRGSLQEFWGATCQFYGTSIRPYPWGCGELRAYSFERKYGATRWTKIDFRRRPPSQSELCRWICSFQFFIFIPWSSWSAGSPELWASFTFGPVTGSVWRPVRRPGAAPWGFCDALRVGPFARRGKAAVEAEGAGKRHARSQA